MSKGENPGADAGEIIPIGVLLVGLIVGGYLLVNQPLSGDTAFVQWILIGLSALGVLYVGVGFRGIHEEEGLHSAVAWLMGPAPNNNRAAGGSSNAKPATSPPSESLKNELYFERANRQCEWCDKRVDSPDIHHIKPRAEGGPNSPKNLIVLCPNCHRKADGGVISQSKLKYQVNKRMGDREA